MSPIHMQAPLNGSASPLAARLPSVEGNFNKGLVSLVTHCSSSECTVTFVGGSLAQEPIQEVDLEVR